MFSVNCTTFDSDGGSDVEAQTVTGNGKATKPAKDPTKLGYTFGGWYNGKTAFDFDKTTITADITLTAKWTINSYTVTFNADNGKDATTASVDYGAKVTKPTEPTKEGYTFVAWYNGDSAFDFDKTTIIADITLTAKWTAITYTVTFDVDGGSDVEAQTVNYGGKATKPETDPEKDGYTFKGWYVGETEYDWDTVLTDDVTIKAVFEYIPKSYEYSISSFPISFSDNTQNYQTTVTGIIPDSTSLKTGDIIKLNISGIFEYEITGFKVVIIDNASDTAFGTNAEDGTPITKYGWNVLSGYPQIAEKIEKNTEFSKSVDVEITADQIGSGTYAHKVVLMYDYSVGKAATLYESKEAMEAAKAAEKATGFYLGSTKTAFSDLPITGSYGGTINAVDGTYTIEAGSWQDFTITFASVIDISGFTSIKITAKKLNGYTDPTDSFVIGLIDSDNVQVRFDTWSTPGFMDPLTEEYVEYTVTSSNMNNLEYRDGGDTEGFNTSKVAKLVIDPRGASGSFMISKIVIEK